MPLSFTVDPKLSHTPRAQSVIGHVHWVQTACDFHANSVKAIPVMAAWHYNWSAAHAAQGEQVYMASQDDDGQAAYPVPKVLVLSPSVWLSLNYITTGLQGMQVDAGGVGIQLLMSSTNCCK